uniref:Uncharacterized protein n=1 Tax=Arundo donax TaxID=35708 RepID=A0A0A9HM52_ARUDO
MLTVYGTEWVGLLYQFDCTSIWTRRRKGGRLCERSTERNNEFIISYSTSGGGDERDLDGVVESGEKKGEERKRNRSDPWHLQISVLRN